MNPANRGRFPPRKKKANKPLPKQGSKKPGIAQIHNNNGMAAEQVVGKIFRGWERVANKPGHDFLATMYNKRRVAVGRRYIEVKSTMSKETDKNKLTIVLKVYGGKWMNQIADDVVILTREMIYFGKAVDIHQHVAQNHDLFRRLPSQDHHEYIAVPIQEMVRKGIIAGLPRKNTNPQDIRRLWREKCLPKIVEEKRPVNRTFFDAFNPPQPKGKVKPNQKRAKKPFGIPIRQPDRRKQ